MKELILIMGILSYTSCITTRRHELSDLRATNDCVSNWIYDSIQDPIDVKIILFDKQYEMTGAKVPTLIIGVAINKDTVAVIDKNFSGDLLIGEQLLALAATGTSLSDTTAVKNVLNNAFMRTFTYAQYLGNVMPIAVHL
jgi:hypothetical protein